MQSNDSEESTTQQSEWKAKRSRAGGAFEAARPSAGDAKPKPSEPVPRAAREAREHGVSERPRRAGARSVQHALQGARRYDAVPLAAREQELLGRVPQTVK